MTENTLNGDLLPVAMRHELHDASIAQVLLGESGVTVYRLQSANAPTRFLKIATGTTRRELGLERARLDWLQGKLPVPRVLYFDEDSEAQYLMLSAVEGVDARQLAGHSDPVHLITTLAHALDVQNCPFDRRLDTVFGELGRRIQQVSVDEDSVDDEWRSTSFQLRREQLSRTRPRDEDLVFVQGDYCFPNILLDPVSLAVMGFIDWGTAALQTATRIWPLPHAALFATWDPAGWGTFSRSMDSSTSIPRKSGFIRCWMSCCRPVTKQRLSTAAQTILCFLWKTKPPRVFLVAA